jgi:formylglycine-generating enzyme
MKKLLLYILAAILISSCRNSGSGELVGVQNREKFYQSDPYGMTYVPLGSFTMGGGDQDVPYAHINDPHTITVGAFYMDETEITNNEYRQFVFWVRDSIMRKKLGEVSPDEFLISENKKTGETYDPPIIKWDARIDMRKEENRNAVEDLYLSQNERYFNKKEFDTRKLIYEYYTIDLQAASRKQYEQGADARKGMYADRPQGFKDRSVYVRKETINVYPDTLTWLHDYAYSYNEPLAKKYFWHPSFDHYPVVGVNWKQASAFCIWRTRYAETASNRKGTISQEFRLPTEAEWEWAARGGNTFSPYPWGGPYTMNDKGCYLANFKPQRGNYTVDGGATPVIVAHYPANDFGLYDMAGNVSEWTMDAYDESAAHFTWDLNPSYTYNAKDDDPISMKRKVIRGGSWKDIAFMMQVGTRTYEYQDTAKCYIGFRTVQPFLGRQKDDSPSRASRIYN